MRAIVAPSAGATTRAAAHEIVPRAASALNLGAALAEPEFVAIDDLGP
jgi:hypothetical protein